MVTVNKNHLLVLVCMIISATLCIGHITGSRILVILAMLLFLGGVVFTSRTGKVLYLLCYFIPWATLIKFEPRTMSIYTIGLIGACLLTWIRYRMTVQRYMLPAVALVMLMVVVRLFYGFGMDNSFIMFCIMLLLFPIMGEDLHQTYDFYHLNFFFSIGIISAALSAYFLVQYPTIARFIDVISVQDITRYSGYYGDPNFYSAHIAAALGGYLILFSHARKRMLESIVMSVTLLYCGLLSVSKSFVIVAALMILLWILLILRIRKHISYKIITIVVIGAIALGIITSDIFSGLFNIIAIRFGSVSNLSDLTTSRSTIWATYLQYLEDNPGVLLFGKGYVNVLIEGRSSHNTILQGVYQFGIVGFIIFIFWLKDLFKITLKNLKLERKQYLARFILVVGVIFPWMSIDLLFFDEFFLMMFYISLGFKWLHKQSDEVTR